MRQHNFTFTFANRNEAYDTFEVLNRTLGRSRHHWGSNYRPLKSIYTASLINKKATVAFYINTSELTLDKLVQLCSNTTIRPIEEHT